MEVTYIPSNEVNSDLGAVNAARVSLHKKSTLLPSLENGSYLRFSDRNLLSYLAKHNHWTPFAHSSLYFSIFWNSIEDELKFYKLRNSAGFQTITHYNPTLKRTFDYIKGSLIGWIKNLDYLPKRLQEFILYEAYLQYPESVKALTGFKEVEPFTYLHGGLTLQEKYLQDLGYYDILSATVLIKVPIAVARQIRTSQVGFAYSDYYVEGESFTYNEVSRRYVTEEPKFYKVEKWRVREGKNVKQGSTGLANATLQDCMECNQEAYLDTCKIDYTTYTRFNLAPEQLRFLLPQSMYTEFYSSGTLKRWCQFLHLRLQPDVQEETREVAENIWRVLVEAYPSYNPLQGLSSLIEG